MCVHVRLLHLHGQGQELPACCSSARCITHKGSGWGNYRKGMGKYQLKLPGGSAGRNAAKNHHACEIEVDERDGEAVVNTCCGWWCSNTVGECHGRQMQNARVKGYV